MNKILLKLRKKLSKYVVVFCVLEGNSYQFIKQVNIKPSLKKIKYDKDNTYIIDIENHTYRQGNTKYYCIDINAEQIYFEKLKQKDFVSSRITKTIFEDEIISQLAKATTTPIKQKYDYVALIIGLIIGVLIGVIIGAILGVQFLIPPTTS